MQCKPDRVHCREWNASRQRNEVDEHNNSLRALAPDGVPYPVAGPPSYQAGVRERWLENEGIRLRCEASRASMCVWRDFSSWKPVYASGKSAQVRAFPSEQIEPFLNGFGQVGM